MFIKIVHAICILTIIAFTLNIPQIVNKEPEVKEWTALDKHLLCVSLVDTYARKVYNAPKEAINEIVWEQCTSHYVKQHGEI